MLAPRIPEPKPSEAAGKQLVAVSILVMSIAWLFVALPALATGNQEPQEHDSSNDLVYGIDLSEHRNNDGVPSKRDDLSGEANDLGVDLSKSVEYLCEHRSVIVAGGAILLLILVNYLAVIRAYHGRATYFADFGDVFWFCLPVAIILLTKGFMWWMFGDITLGNEVVVVCLAFACLYNLIRPFVDNRRAPLLLTVSICVSRFTLGHLLVLGMAWTLVGINPAKQKDESNEAYELRRQTAMIQGAAILAGIGFLIHSLVGRVKEYDPSERDDIVS